MDRIGGRLKRIEDPPLLRGEGRFAADLNWPGQCVMRIVRSPVAFGKLLAIDTDEARDAPGVVAVWTAADVADIPPIGFRQVRVPGLENYRQHVLARDYVRYVGEPLAIVFAEDAYAAEDAAELVFADIDELTPCIRVTDPLFAWGDGLESEPAIVRKETGDVDAAFAAAAHVFELDLAVGRHSGVPLETRGALAVYNEEKRRLEMHGASKIPHINRETIAELLDLPLDELHLFEGHVGGGFGIRGEVYPEDVLVCLAALRLRRPVKWIEDRKEHLVAANHSRDQVHHLRAAVDADGRVLAFDDEFWVDQGAYVRTHAATVTDLTAGLLPGPYKLPAFRAVGHIRLSNKTPAGTYRAPGRYEGSFVRERMMDKVADELGIDRVELRRLNLIAAADMPFDRGVDALGTPVVYDSGDFAGLLDKLLVSFEYERLERELAARRAAGESVGAGLGFFIEKSGFGPFDDVRIEMRDDGHVEIVTGVASVGQGVETSLAQICSDVLAVPYDKIRVVHGQTDLIARGRGAFASRVTVMTGSAVLLASLELREKLLAKAAELLQQPAEALTLANGEAIVADTPLGGSIPLATLVGHCGGEAGTLSAEATFNSTHMAYPYGIHLAVVRVDRETCCIAVERFIVAVDIGRAVNPMLVEGQIAGGAAQGIGGALYEDFVYSEDGQPLATGFADYLMPTLNEVPRVEMLIAEDAPSPLNPLGVKGAGEGGIAAAGAAIAAAIDAALGRPGAVTRLPVKPADIHALLKGA